MIRFGQVFYSPEGAGGGQGDGGDAGGDADAGGGESWHNTFAYFQNNPDAVKAFSKYADADAAFKGAHDTMRKMGAPFRVPDAGAKLTDAQRQEFSAALAKFRGVPDSPEGYEFEIPEGAAIDEQAMSDYRRLAHERGIDPDTAKDLLGVQLDMVKRLTEHRAKVIQGMTDNNYKTFLNDDCGGDKELAGQRLEEVKRFLQLQFTRDGEIDTDGWEKFAARIMHGDRIIELPILRALSRAAQMEVGTGGAPPDYGRQMAKSGAFGYAEMDRK
jgi:hypothetical protein